MRVGRDAKWKINQRQNTSAGRSRNREASVFSVQFGEAGLGIGKSDAHNKLLSRRKASAVVDDGEMKPSI